MRPELDRTMAIDAIQPPNPSQFPNLCFNLKKGDDWGFFVVFFSGILHSVAEEFESQLCSVVCLVPD